MKELQIIRTISEILGEAVDLTDDAFYDAATRQILTTDLMVEGRHFSLDYFSPEDLGWKAAAINISDVAAMGGRPEYLLVSLGLPDDMDGDDGFIRRFYTGMKRLAEETGCRIVGGDLAGMGLGGSDCIVVNVIATGRLPEDHMPGLRRHAEPGDVVIASGPHGLSAAGLHALQSHTAGWDPLKTAHLRPMPRVREALALSGRLKRYALMDTSDGLADAALKIAETSGVRIHLEREALISGVDNVLLEYSEKAGADWLSWILYGGEDFELFATVPDGVDLSGTLAESFSVIGRVASGEPGAYLLDAGGRVTETLSLEKTYRHFDKREKGG